MNFVGGVQLLGLHIREGRVQSDSYTGDATSRAGRHVAVWRVGCLLRRPAH